jgi:ribosomal protein S8
MVVMIDGLVRIQNAYRAGYGSVVVKRSKFLYEILMILREEGYIYGFFVMNRGLVVYIKRRGLRVKFRFFSKPSCRKYIGYEEIKRRYLNTRALLIVSTCKGVLSSREIVEGIDRVGGELLIEVLIATGGRAQY